MTDRLDSSRASSSVHHQNGQPQKLSGPISKSRLPLLISNNDDDIHNNTRNNNKNNSINSNNHGNNENYQFDQNQNQILSDENTIVTLNQKVEVKLKNQRNYNKLLKRRLQKSKEYSLVSQQSGKSTEHSLNSSGGVSKVTLDLDIPEIQNSRNSLLPVVSLPKSVRSARNIFSTDSPKILNSGRNSKSGNRQKFPENLDENNKNENLKGITSVDNKDFTSVEITENPSLLLMEADPNLSKLAGLSFLSLFELFFNFFQFFNFSII